MRTSSPGLSSPLPPALLQAFEFVVHILMFGLRNLDPIFAVFIGTSAAVVRVGREEREKGRSAGESFEALKRRVGMAFQG